MSRTKDRLFSLPQAKQNKVLGEPDYFQRLPEPEPSPIAPRVADIKKCLELLNGTIAVEEKQMAQSLTEPSAFDRAYMKTLYERREKLQASLAKAETEEAGIDPDYEAWQADRQ